MMEPAWKYKPYPEYKDSGIEWLGVIPEHWESIRIRHLSIVKRGASPRPIDDPKYFDDDGEYSWVRIADVTASDRYLTQTTQRMSNLGKSLSVPMKPGDIFLSIAGSVGKPIITKIKCCIHDGFVYFPSYKGDREFLYYIFSSGQPYLGLGKLGTQLNLNTDTVGNIHIGFPPTEEQQAITSFLDRETARIDELIAKKEQLIALLEEKRTAMISHAVTKGLNPDAKMKDSGIEWLGEIPEHWNILSIKYLLQVKDGTHDTPDFVVPSDDTYPLLTSKDLFTGSINFDEAKHISQQDYVNISKRSDSEYGDVLLPMIGTIGNPVIVYDKRPFSIKNIALFKTSKSQIDKRYIYYFILSNLCSTQFDLLTRGGVQGFVSLFILRNLKLFYMSLDEYRYIADYLDFETAQIDELIKKNYGVIEKLQEYRTALISAAVTGKIDVREQI